MMNENNTNSEHPILSLRLIHPRAIMGLSDSEHSALREARADVRRSGDVKPTKRLCDALARAWKLGCLPDEAFEPLQQWRRDGFWVRTTGESLGDILDASRIKG